MDIREVLRELSAEMRRFDGHQFGHTYSRCESWATRIESALASLPAEAQGDGAVAWDRCDACSGTLGDHYAPDGGGCPGFRKQVPTETDAEERKRLRLAGISTAALGYWKEGDTIHPDYDTPALRDVAKLYAKYDELFQAAAPPAVKVPKWMEKADESEHAKGYARGWNACRDEVLRLNAPTVSAQKGEG